MGLCENLPEALFGVHLHRWIVTYPLEQLGPGKYISQKRDGGRSRSTHYLGIKRDYISEVTDGKKTLCWFV